MESSAEREPYWLLAEVATWIRTRDLNQVSGIVDLNMPLAITVDTKQALKELHDCCRNGYVRSKGRRCTDYDSIAPNQSGSRFFGRVMVRVHQATLPKSSRQTSGRIWNGDHPSMAR